MIRARLCKQCGYAHFGDSIGVDCCHNCGVTLDAETSDYPQKLFPQPTVRALARQRISSEEETRQRHGYRITTHFAFPPNAEPIEASVLKDGGDPLLLAKYSPTADIWRINHGWRRSEVDGFSLEPATGKWSSRNPADTPDNENPDLLAPINGIRPYVRDSRNLLLIQPADGGDDESFLTTLLHAIKLGIEAEYQLEGQEVAAELIGEGENRRLMFWEAAEGGTGVWERLVEDAGAIAGVARAALKRCHFDLDGNDTADNQNIVCAAACYECLLSYANQPSHRYLDRFSVRDLLVELSSATTERSTQGRSRDEQYEWLKAKVDPASPLEPRLLAHLYENGYRLPDESQFRPVEDVYSQPDFYYRRGTAPGVCIFVDGSQHFGDAQALRDTKARTKLESRGYTVVAIRFDRVLDEQLLAYTDIFGENS